MIARLPSLRQTFRRIQRLAPEDRHGEIENTQRNSSRDAIQQVNVIADFLQYWASTSHNLAVQVRVVKMENKIQKYKNHEILKTCQENLKF